MRMRGGEVFLEGDWGVKDERFPRRCSRCLVWTASYDHLQAVWF
jgi:hypothetical protein